MKIELYDTTLRDGAQQSGISLSLKDKINITLKLDELGIDTIEGGYAGSNPKDDEYFKLIQKENIRNSNISAFGSTRKPDSNIEDDAIVNALLSSEAKVIAVVGKSSSKQVLKVLETSLDENLKMIEETVSFLANRDRRVIFDAEHFFDGFYSDKDYALKTLIAAYESGADIVTLCDTNGGMIPENIEKVIEDIVDQFQTWYVKQIHDKITEMGITTSIIIGWTNVMEKLDMQTGHKYGRPFDLVDEEFLIKY